MSDGLSHGADATRQRTAFADYIGAILDHVEDPRNATNREAVRLAAEALDEAMRVPPYQSITKRLSEKLAKLREGDQVAWSRLLMATDEQASAFYDRALALSPFKGKTLLHVEHWNGGTTSIDGEFVRRLGEALRQHRKHDDRYRERFIVAIDMPAITENDVVRIPRDDD